jgi:hypothetical protein
LPTPSDQGADGFAGTLELCSWTVGALSPATQSHQSDVNESRWTERLRAPTLIWHNPWVWPTMA